MTCAPARARGAAARAGAGRAREWTDDEVVLLAHLLGDGSFVKRQPIRYASIDEQNLGAVTKAALVFGVAAVRDDYAAARCTTLRLRAPFRARAWRAQPDRRMAGRVGTLRLRSHEKFVPETVFHVSKRQIALFIRHIWATDGSVTVNKSGEGGRIYYASTSRRLVDDLSRLLLRFGISTRTPVTKRPATATATPSTSPAWTTSAGSCRRSASMGISGSPAERLLDDRPRTKTANTNVDTVPVAGLGPRQGAMVEQG